MLEDTVMADELARLKDVAYDLKYLLRLNKLDKTNRVLQRNHVVDARGFLTIDGAQMFLDMLWQKHPEMQKQLADEVAKARKELEDEDK
jgi:hypothetical protein